MSRGEMPAPRLRDNGRSFQFVSSFQIIFVFTAEVYTNPGTLVLFMTCSERVSAGEELRYPSILRDLKKKVIFGMGTYAHAP